MHDETFILGDWQVKPADNSIISDIKTSTLEPKAMDVLVRLCREPGEVLSADALLELCWCNAPMGDNPVHKAINQLRKALGDVASNPSYIETIRKRGYRIVAPVRHLSEPTLQATWQQGSPFAGLSAFGPEQADVFYGRNQQVATLLDRVVKQVDFGRAFCLVLGRSGSGKSSLIQAGLMPALARPGGYQGVRQLTHSAIDLADISSDQFWLDVASALLDWEANDLPVFEGMSAELIAQHLISDDGIKALMQRCAAVVDQHRQQDQRPQLVLFIDRLEVLLADDRMDEQIQQQFIHLITEFSDSGSVLVLSACRNDFYPQLARHSALMAGKASGAHFDLEPPSRAEIMDMIRLPAQAAGLSWDVDPDSGSGLDELLCAQASSSEDALPLLQYTLQELYLQREDDLLTIASYRDMGGLEGALSQKAETMLTQLDDAAQASLPRILSLLINLAADETSITSRTGRWAQLQSSQERSLVQALVDQRLFVSHIMNGEASFSVAHEALFRQWPRVLEWIEQHRDSLKTKTRLTQLAQRWRDEGNGNAYLLSVGKPLQEAQALSANPLFELDALERSLLDQSEKRARRRQWVRTGVAAALIGLTVISLLMAQLSRQSQQLAQKKRVEAESLLGFMVGEFAHKLRTVGRMDLLDGISNKALEYFVDSDSSNAGLSFTARLQHGQTMEAIGEVALSRHKPDEAHEALTLAQTVFQTLLKEQPDNFELLKQLGANAFWLSTIPFEKGDYVQAEAYVQQYLHYSERMYHLLPNNLDSIQELSYATNTLGSLAHRNNEFLKAQDFFSTSLELKLQALKQLPDDVLLLTDLASTYSWLASGALSMGDAQASIEFLGLEQQTFQQLKAREHQNLQADFEQALSFYRQALLLKHQRQYVAASDAALKAQRLLSKLVQADPDNAAWQVTHKRVQVLQITIVAIDVETNLLSPEAVTQLDGYQRFIVEQFSGTERVASQGVVSLLWELDEAQQRLGRWGQSAELHRLMDTHLGAASETGDDALMRSNRLLSEAALLRYQGKLESSREFCAQALVQVEPLTQISSSPSHLIPYARSLDCLNKLHGDRMLAGRLAALKIPTVKF